MGSDEVPRRALTASGPKFALWLATATWQFGVRLWAAPWTALGLLLGALGMATGGAVRPQDGVLEFHGGMLRWCLARIPIPGGAAAITLGHTVLARTRDDLERTRRHEAVHVRQYERWGLFFVPAYLGASAWLWLAGQDPYRDNPFEREAWQAD